MMKSFLIICASFFFFNFTTEKEVEILVYQNFEDSLERLYLTYDVDNGSKNENFDISKKPYKLSIKVTEPEIAYLTAVFKNEQDPSRKKYAKVALFIEAGSMIIKATDNLKSAKISGSKSQEYFSILENMKAPFEIKSRELIARSNEFRKDKNELEINKTETEIGKLESDLKEEVYKNFLQKYPASPISLYVLRLYAGYDFNASEIEMGFKKLSLAAQSSSGGRKFNAEIETAKKTEVGTIAMNFTQNDTLGKPVSLSSFKGKYVLLDFWASWCGPCRADNPNVVKAFNEFKSKNFTVLSVSLDKPGKQQLWLDAIHKDGLTWTHVSDLNFWDNAVAKQYGIRAVPQNFLIDPNGVIIAKNLSGEGLTKTLSEMIK